MVAGAAAGGGVGMFGWDGDEKKAPMRLHTFFFVYLEI
jgi:hypothetical protein